MRWFRFWTEALHKPKIRRLSHQAYRFWTHILCIASESEPWGTLPPVEDIADITRMNVQKAQRLLAVLEAAGLVDVADDGTVRPHNWDQWQKPSDSSSNRVAAFRKRGEAVTETVPEQNRTELETETEEIQSRGRQRADPAVSRSASGFVVKDDLIGRWKSTYPGVDVPHEIAKAFEWEQAHPAQRKVNLQAFLTRWLARAQDSPRNGQRLAPGGPTLEARAKATADRIRRYEAEKARASS